MSSDEVNEAERRRWNDEAWAAAWPRREHLTACATSPLLDALLPIDGDRVLDVGSGAGGTALEVARRTAPNGLVVGADLSVPLTAFAQRRATDEGITNARFLVADLQVDRVEGGLFDAAMSQFGVMFFDEPVTAFRNVRDNVVAGGRLCFAAWLSLDENPWFVGPVLAALVEPAPPPAPGKHATGPFVLADPNEVAAILEAAGWVDVVSTAHRSRTVVPRDAIGDDAQLHRMGVRDEDFAAAKSAVDAYLDQFAVDDEHCEVPTALAVTTARAAP